MCEYVCEYCPLIHGNDNVDKISESQVCDSNATEFRINNNNTNSRDSDEGVGVVLPIEGDTQGPIKVVAAEDQESRTKLCHRAMQVLVVATPLNQVKLQRRSHKSSLWARLFPCE